MEALNLPVALGIGKGCPGVLEFWAKSLEMYLGPRKNALHFFWD